MPLLLEIASASGVYLYGPNNEKYMDLISGIGVNNIGHCHPKVVAAIKNQAEQKFQPRKFECPLLTIHNVLNTDEIFLQNKTDQSFL